MTNPYAEWFERLRAEYGEQLSTMPLPEGLPEHLRDLMARGDDEAILFMLRLAWQFGAQAGYAAANQETANPKAAPRRTTVQA
ncbi:hypothetical protein [Deinococcus pimensis]|uniref:hypothetical protein n=1 Tax=Deinococcus pimensis TaxID=309888 RepID=UPI000486504C|nr:hypothetical protein [Deinococcus pimensis]